MNGVSEPNNANKLTDSSHWQLPRTRAWDLDLATLSAYDTPVPRVRRARKNATVDTGSSASVGIKVAGIVVHWLAYGSA